MKRFFKWLGIIVLVVVVIAGLFFGYTFYKLNKMQHAADVNMENVELTKKPFSVVLMGLDTSIKRSEKYGNTARTDALMVATVSPHTGYVSLLSIPRDTYVYQPMRGISDKINHAFAFNKEEGTLITLSNWLDENFQFFVTIDFNGFMEVIDAIGGIEVDVPVEIREQNSKDVAGAIHIKPGLQTLNAEEALALVRMRKADTDAQRGQRQMLVIQALTKKLLSASSIPAYPKIMDVASRNIKTNIPIKDAALLGFNWFRKNINVNFETFQIKGSDTRMGGIYYYLPDQNSVEEQKARIKAELEGSKDSTETSESKE